MKKKRMRILAVTPVLACLVCTAAIAAGNDLDKNHDGIVNIWDAQKVFLDDTISTEEKSTLLGQIKTDILSAASNVTQITTAEQLKAMANSPNANYILAADIDMKGAVWTPVDDFSGIFDGNGYTISNVTIQAAADNNVGFFGSVTEGGAVDHLNLEDVTVKVPDGALNVGLIAGSNAGDITRSTVSGSIVDTEGSAVIGIAVGSNTGTVQLDGFSVGEGENESYHVNVAAEVCLDLPEDAVGKMIGDGNAANGNTLWRDTSYSTLLLDEELQERRQTAVDHMTEMATVEWTPAQDMTDYMYYNTSSSKTTFHAGQTYRGLPYNNGSGSLARFQYALEQDGASVNGVHNEEITDGSFLDENSLYMGGAVIRALQGKPNDGETYYTNAAGKERLETVKSLINTIDKEELEHGENYSGISGINLAGFGRWLGNDCSSSLVYSWWQVSNADVANGGVSANAALEMRPSVENEAFGIQNLNGFTYADDKTPSENEFAEAYARAGKADVIACSDHVRLLAYDPVVIRDADGTVNKEVSYMITIGHGGVSGSNTFLDSSTKWGYLCKYTFAELMSGNAAKQYYPATIDVLNNVNCQATVDDTEVTMSGTTITSNAQIVSVQAGDIIFFTGVEQSREYDPEAGVEKGFRDVYTTVDLSTEEEFENLDLTNITITVTLADGSEWTFSDDDNVATASNASYDERSWDRQTDSNAKTASNAISGYSQN